MAQKPINVPDELARFAGLDTADIRAEWQRLHRLAAPARLSRDMMIRGIVYRLQERAIGPLPKALVRRLENAQTTSDRTSASTRRARPGTRLVRDWHGETHSVTVLGRGYEWRGRTYRSLSLIAREITGTNWSGPRFFGLTKRRQAANE